MSAALVQDHTATCIVITSRPEGERGAEAVRVVCAYCGCPGMEPVHFEPFGGRALLALCDDCVSLVWGDAATA